MTSMEVDGDGASAARRRRERRLRSWWRQECQSVRMALTTAAHHSAEKVAADVKDAGLRAQTMVSAGQRPGVLTEPEPQGGAVTVGYVAAPVPSLAVQLLAGAAGEAVDSSSLRFLLQQSLAVKKEEEEERRKVMEELDVLMRIPFIQLTPDQRAVVERPGAFQDWKAWSSASAAGRRKKKRKKKKLPKTSSGPLHRLPRGARLRRCGHGFRSRSSLSGPRSTSWPVRIRSTVTCSSCRLVSLAILHLARCFLPCLQARDARHQGRYGPEGFFRQCKAWFAGFRRCPSVLLFLLVTTHLVLRSFVVFAPKMLGILVDTDQQDSYGDVGKDCVSLSLVWCSSSCPLQFIFKVVYTLSWHRGFSHGSGYSADHRDSLVAVH